MLWLYAMTHDADEPETSFAAETRPTIRRQPSWPKPASQAALNVLRQIPGIDLALVQLQQQWSEIIGRPYADWCQPEKILTNKTGGGAVLQLSVMGAAALELQHMQPQLIEKINRYAGYGWIRDLRLVQGYRPKAMAAASPPPAKPPITAKIALPEIADPELRAALEGLGSVLPPATDDE